MARYGTFWYRPNFITGTTAPSWKLETRISRACSHSTIFSLELYTFPRDRGRRHLASIMQCPQTICFCWLTHLSHGHRDKNIARKHMRNERRWRWTSLASVRTRDNHQVVPYWRTAKRHDDRDIVRVVASPKQPHHEIGQGQFGDKPPHSEPRLSKVHKRV